MQNKFIFLSKNEGLRVSIFPCARINENTHFTANILGINIVGEVSISLGVKQRMYHLAVKAGEDIHININTGDKVSSCECRSDSKQPKVGHKCMYASKHRIKNTSRSIVL